jgi:hypothetical protein
MKKLALLLLCVASAFAADQQIRLEGVVMSDKGAFAQTNGIRYTQTVNTGYQGLLTEFRMETLQNKTASVARYNQNVLTGFDLRKNVPSYVSLGVVKPDIIKIQHINLGLRVAAKGQFGPNGTNSALAVLEPRANISMGRLTLKAAYEYNTSMGNDNIKFNTKKLGVDYRLFKVMGVSAGYEQTKGFLHRNAWVGGLVFQL